MGGGFGGVVRKKVFSGKIMNWLLYEDKDAVKLDAH